MNKRVLMIGWEYPPKNSGGLGVACQGIVENLVDSGQEALLVLPNEVAETTMKIMMTKSGREYPVIFLPSTLKAYPDSLPNKYSGNLIQDVYKFANDVLTAVRGEKFDLIHVHDWLTVPAGIALKKKFKKPLVMHVHSTEFDRTAGGEPNFEVSQIEQSGFLNADRIIAVSGYTKGILTDLYKISADKVNVVYNGIDPNIDISNYESDFLGKVPVVLFVGRLTIQKGVDYFIRMAKKVLGVRPETVFVIVGDGDMYRNLVEYSAFAELTGSVLFPGFLRGGMVEKLYKRADVFVMPSVSEPFGLVALEAALFGVPVIVSKTSGVAEVLPSAIKIDFWDSDLAAEEIITLMSDEKKKKRLGVSLKKEASRMNWKTAALEIKKIYQDL